MGDPAICTRKGFDGGKIVASAAIGGVTSGLSAMKLIATTGKVSKMMVESSFSAAGAASESMIHDSLDGKTADLGKALTSVVLSVPGIGNASTLSKITSGGVSSKVESSVGEVLNEEASQALGKLAGDTAGALVGSAIKGVENWAKENDKDENK